MEDKIKFLSHKNKKIIYIDHSGRKGRDYSKKVAEMVEEVIKIGKEEKLPLLIDVTGSVVDKDVVEEFIKGAGKIKNITTRIAGLGVVGVKKTLAKYVGKVSNVDFKIFTTTEEALDWLAEEK